MPSLGVEWVDAFRPSCRQCRALLGGQQGRLSPRPYSACLVTFSSTPTQARVMNSDDPP